MYWALLKVNKEEFHLQDDEKSQIISFMNNSCHVLNQFGVWVYNNHLMYSLDGRKKKTRFDVGDKVICTQNNDVIIYHHR